MKTSLKEIAEALNEVLGLKPAIPTEGIKKADLTTQIANAAKLVDPATDEKEFTPEVVTDLKELGFWPEGGDTAEEAPAEEAAPEKGKGKDKSKKEKDVLKEPKKAKKEKGPGVIATIVELIEKSGKKGITKEEILNELVKKFPDKAKDSMKNTINVQVPNRITKEKWPVEKTEAGKYFKK